MKPRAGTTAKVGTKGTKSLPEGVGVAVKPFPIDAFSQDELGRHDLGEILTPEQMAAKVPLGASPGKIAAAMRKALDALAGCGPGQVIPHLETRLALSAGLARLRDFALAGDRDAAAALGAVLSEAVADLAELARRKPEVVRAWSSKQNVVPVLTGKNVAQTGNPKKGDIGQLRRDLDAFAVGQASPYKINPEHRRGGGAFNANTQVNALAGALCQHLATYRFPDSIMKSPVPKWARMASRLKPLSKESAKEWGAAAFECLMSATGSQPETFLKLGDGRENEGRGAMKQKIKGSLFEAIRRIAAPAADEDNPIIASKT